MYIKYNDGKTGLAYQNIKSTGVLRLKEQFPKIWNKT